MNFFTYIRTERKLHLKEKQKKLKIKETKGIESTNRYYVRSATATGRRVSKRVRHAGPCPCERAMVTLVTHTKKTRP